jgi:hypothetical protein
MQRDPAQKVLEQLLPSPLHPAERILVCVRTEDELSNVNNELWLSSVSVWEALVLMQNGRVQVEL